MSFELFLIVLLKVLTKNYCIFIYILICWEGDPSDVEDILSELDDDNNEPESPIFELLDRNV